jgi:hypothetical protein
LHLPAPVVPLLIADIWKHRFSTCFVHLCFILVLLFIISVYSIIAKAKALSEAGSNTCFIVIIHFSGLLHFVRNDVLLLLPRFVRNDALRPVYSIIAKAKALSEAGSNTCFIVIINLWFASSLRSSQ